MDTRPLLFGLIGFFLGGLLVSVAATTFDKPSDEGMSMSHMTAALETKTGDAYDKAFTEYMIEHHQSAVDMAKLSGDRADRNEIKELSKDIISAQQSEIGEMKQWQRTWGYDMTDINRSH